MEHAAEAAQDAAALEAAIASSRLPPAAHARLEVLAALRAVPEDGYFQQNTVHHLLGAGRVAAARALLLDPTWLERKLSAGGAAGGDFRLLLLARPGDANAKLELEAFQLSAGAGAAHGRAAPELLRAQLAGRLAAASVSPALARWLHEQAAADDADAAAALARGRPRALPVRGPSLDQTGGLARLALRGRAGAPRMPRSRPRAPRASPARPTAPRASGTSRSAATASSSCAATRARSPRSSAPPTARCCSPPRVISAADPARARRRRSAVVLPPRAPFDSPVFPRATSLPSPESRPGRRGPQSH
jgi:hypothetical protein